MCGIAGIVNLRKHEVEKQRIHRMLDTIRHRGPNDSGVFQKAHIGLGHVRLSILDLTQAGHQPMTDATGRYVMVYNGEIYNYIELRTELQKDGVTFATNTDSEVLLQAYIHWGRNGLNQLNGMFAFAVYDMQEDSLFIARDRYGVKPLYYYQSEDELIFASEIPAILQVYGQKNQANDQAIFDYLAFNRTDQTDMTFFQGINKLQHGCVLEWRNNQVAVSQWYNLRERVCKQSIKSNPAEFKELLKDAVRVRLRSDVPVGVCLSGGLDSSTIVSLLACELNKPDVNTFSAIYKDSDADESKFINMYAERLTNMYYTYPTSETLMADLSAFVRAHAEPVPSTGPYAQYKVMNLAKKHVTVTLDGQGADEELAGYHYFYGLYYKSLFKQLKWFTLCKEIVAYLRIYHSLYALKTFLFFLLPGSMRTKVRVHERGYIDEHFATMHKDSVIADNLYASKSMQDALINHFEYKLEHLLKWEDRNSMFFSLESRTPFLDFRVVEYLLSCEDSAKICNGYTKSILREAMRGLLPEAIRTRKDKKGFSTPEDDWFRTEPFKKFILELLHSESFSKRGYFVAEECIKQYTMHYNRQINISKDIWKWINLELWCRQFIDSQV